MVLGGRPQIRGPGQAQGSFCTLSPPLAASPHCRANSTSIPTAHILFYATALLPRHITSITLVSAVPVILIN